MIRGLGGLVLGEGVNHEEMTTNDSNEYFTDGSYNVNAAALQETWQKS